MDDYRALFIVFMASIAVLGIVAVVYILFFQNNPLNLLSDEVITIILFVFLDENPL
ncbi:MAG: hypothetical protein ACFFDN_09010 [Candidatus Hodarchaeota archaeon]